jgi:hypothetical protein
MAVDLHERLLHGVHGLVGVSEVGEGNPKQALVVALHERPERGPVAAGQTLEKLPIGWLHGRLLAHETRPERPTFHLPARITHEQGRRFHGRGELFRADTAAYGARQHRTGFPPVTT